jgi:opacity protein-like surface antigen
MFKFAKPALLGATLLASVSGALAADIIEPIVEAPPPVVYEEPSYGNWYIRGDIDYHWSDYKNDHYITYGPPPGTASFTEGELEGAWSIGGGVGYQASKYLRTDLTVDWFADSDFRGSTAGFCAGLPCVSTDASSYSALVLLANAYVEFGSWNRFRPYVGAGIGGAYVKWDDLQNTIPPVTTTHKGSKNWRFAAALMAGASYCLTKDLDLDAGYRFTHIEGGRQFEFANGAGPGFDDGINVHEVRAGLRWNFGGTRTGCEEPEQVVYQPEPVYK